jgi:hypothetical protein
MKINIKYNVLINVKQDHINLDKILCHLFHGRNNYDQCAQKVEETGEGRSIVEHQTPNTESWVRIPTELRLFLDYFHSLLWSDV